MANDLQITYRRHETNPGWEAYLRYPPPDKPEHYLFVDEDALVAWIAKCIKLHGEKLTHISPEDSSGWDIAYRASKLASAKATH